MADKLTKAQCLQHVKEINRLHGEIVEADQTSLENAMDAGEMLIALKKTVEHGEWLSYVAKHFPTFSKRTAQDYMWAANNREEIEKAKAEAENGETPNAQRAALLTSIRGAKEALSKPRTKGGGGGGSQRNPSQPSAPSTEPETPASAPIDVQLESLDVDEVVPALKEKWDYDQRKALIVALLKDLTLTDAAEVLFVSFPSDMLRDIVGRVEAVRSSSPPKSAPTSPPSIVRPEQPAALDRRY
jgi:hypothetical protein